MKFVVSLLILMGASIQADAKLIGEPSCAKVLGDWRGICEHEAYPGYKYDLNLSIREKREGSCAVLTLQYTDGSEVYEWERYFGRKRTEIDEPPAPIEGAERITTITTSTLSNDEMRSSQNTHHFIFQDGQYRSKGQTSSESILRVSVQGNQLNETFLVLGIPNFSRWCSFVKMP